MGAGTGSGLTEVVGIITDLRLGFTAADHRGGFTGFEFGETGPPAIVAVLFSTGVGF